MAERLVPPEAAVPLFSAEWSWLDGLFSGNDQIESPLGRSTEWRIWLGGEPAGFAHLDRQNLPIGNENRKTFLLPVKQRLGVSGGSDWPGGEETLQDGRNKGEREKVEKIGRFVGKIEIQRNPDFFSEA